MKRFAGVGEDSRASTLFGDWVLLREWGGIGSPGRVRRDRHQNESEAISALAKLARQKHRRGYALQEMQ